MVALANTPPPPSFEGVDALFAPMRGPLDPSRYEGVGERIAARFFDLCENPRTRRRMLRIVRNSARSAVAGRLLMSVTSKLVFNPILRSRRLDDAAIRVELIVAELAGLAVVRYVTKLEPIASMPIEELVRRVGPSVQLHLTGSSL